jgi:hypothetical protein
MRAVLIAAVIAIGLAPQVPGLAQEPAPVPQGPKVKITFEPNGLVSLVANGATPQEIFAEWTRVGGSAFVNGDRMQRAPLTLQYTSRPESEVIGSILRQASGYMLAARREGSTAASIFESVWILPTSNPSSSGFVQQPMPQQQQMISTLGSPDDEIAPVQAGRGVGAAPGQQPAPGSQPPGPQPAPDNNYRAPGVSSVVVPVVPVIPVTNANPTNPNPPNPTTTTTGRAGNAAGS